MPGYKRWFPVSQHINRDPELWDLCRQFGDRSIRIWLEILSIADRHGGVIPGASTELSPDLRRALADASRTSGQTVANCWRRLIELSWIAPSEPAKISNYADYHRTRKTNSATANANVSVHLPSEPSEPNLNSKKKSKILLPPDFQVSESIKALAQEKEWPSPEAEIEAFRDNHVSKGTRMLDWEAAFRTWLRNAKRFAGNGTGKDKVTQLRQRTADILTRGLK